MLLKRILPSIRFSDTVSTYLVYPSLIKYAGNYVWSFHSDLIVYLTHTNSLTRPAISDEDLAILALLPTPEAKQEYLTVRLKERSLND